MIFTMDGAPPIFGTSTSSCLNKYKETCDIKSIVRKPTIYFHASRFDPLCVGLEADEHGARVIPANALPIVARNAVQNLLSCIAAKHGAPRVALCKAWKYFSLLNLLD